MNKSELRRFEIFSEDILFVFLFVQVFILIVKCEVKSKNKTCGSSKGKNEFVSRDIIEL